MGLCFRYNGDAALALPRVDSRLISHPNSTSCVDVRNSMTIARYTALLFAAGLVLTCGSLATADDWPQWRGPQRDGISAETGLLKEWPPEGPKQVWISREAGLGYAGPAIVGDRLYTLGSLEGDSHLMAFDTKTGKRVWATRLGPDYDNRWGDGPRSTPSVEGDLVWAMGARGVLICCKASDGGEVWRVNMEDLGGTIPTWGYAESPLVDGDKVLCTPGGSKGAIAALNKMTGELLWQTEELADEAHYSSIVKSKRDRYDIYVQLLVKRAVGINANNGTVLWESPWPGQTAVIPTPLIDGDDVFITSGYGAGCRLLTMNARGDSVKTAYENKDMTSKHNGLVKVGKYLYGFSDGKGWVCLDWESGETVWRERGKLGKGSIAYADGMLYLLGEDDGDVVLIEASPDGWNEKGRFTLEPQTEQRADSGRIWVHPVIANGKLYLRDQELLYSFDVKQP
jgi:outer membrane protein assembly factor BamB